MQGPDSQGEDQAVLRWHPTGGLQCHYWGIGITPSELTLRLKCRWETVGAGDRDKAIAIEVIVIWTRRVSEVVR